jgi:hypothetical protein
MGLSFWRDLAVVFLAVETTVLLTVLVVAFYFAIRGLNAAHVRLPRLLFRVQDVSRTVRTKTEVAGEKIGAPIIKTQRSVTKAEATVQALLSDPSKKNR